MVDRISKLPDEVLCHILSFLPTEEAVTTMVLSKRWKPLWPSVSTLDLVDDRYLDAKESKPYSSFIKFVYAAILSRGLNQPIKNFTLNCDDCPYSNVKVWLNAAIQRQLENLYIDLSPSRLPCTILTCTTLAVFKLRFVKFDAFSSVYLPSLKTMHLDNVWFGKRQFFRELLYGCPALEDLKADRIIFLDDSFEGKCDLDIPVFSNLIHLELIFGGSFNWSSALDMLNRFPKLQIVVFELNFGGDDDDDDDDELWPYQCSVPECFYSHLRKCFLKYFRGLECQMRFVRYVMQNSASLRTMTIHCKGQNREREFEMIKELASYPRSSSICELLFK